MQVKVEVLQMQPKNTNSILVSIGKDCIIFDSWGKAGDWVNVLKDRGFNLRAIYSTHGHVDHVSAAPELAQKFNVPWYVNHRDIDLILPGNPLLEYFELPIIPEDYKRPNDLRAGTVSLFPRVDATVVECPGHSAGGVAFYLKEQNLLLIGDTLFQDSIGRYDFPGGNNVELFESISNIYNMDLPDDTVVIHGHGMETTIGWLKENNPYFKA